MTQSFPTLERAYRALESFNDGPEFFDTLAPHVVAEFPYGPTLGLPARLEGKSAVEAHLRAVQQSGLRLSEFQVTTINETQCLAEYVGHYRAATGESFESTLVSVITFEGDKISALREYWNTKQIADSQHG